MSTTQESIESLKRTKARLHEAAAALSEEMGGAPIVVVAGGGSERGVEATVAGWANIAGGRQGRFRDIVGILQSAIQLESFLHYMEDDLFQDLKQQVQQRTWWSSGAKPGSRDDQ